MKALVLLWMWGSLLLAKEDRSFELEELQKLKVSKEDKAALEELLQAESRPPPKNLEKVADFFNEQGIDYRQLEEEDFVLMPPGMQDIPRPDRIVSAVRKLVITTAEPPPDEYEIFDSLIRSASIAQFGDDSTTSTTSSSSFSFSFPPASDTANTFSTTATPPSALNTVMPAVGRQESFHGKNDTSYMIGALIPLTINDTGTLQGVQYAEAFKCAINVINSNSRILRNTLLTWLIEDTGNLPSQAANQAYLFNRRDISMVVGPYEYDSLPPVANLYNNVTLPFISYGSAGVQYSNGTVYPSFFRTIPSDLSTARAMAETMRLFGWNFVAAIFTTDSYGQSGRTALLQQIGRQRLKVTCVNQIDPGSVRGLPNFADCVAKSDASVVVLWMDEANAANTLSYLYQNATNTRLTFMAPDRWALIKNPKTFNDTLPRTNYTFPLDFIEGTLGFVPQIGSLSLYKACMSAVTPNTTNYPVFNQVWQREFRCIINASDTVPLCPPAIEDRVFNCRCTGDENLADVEPDPKVNYVIDSVNVFATTLNQMINNCGTFRIGNWCNRSIIANSDINLAIPQLSFNGLTGVIAFNQTRPDRRRSFLDLYQYNSEAETYQVGFWNLSGPFYSQSLLVFKTYPEVPVSILVPENTEFGATFWTSAVCIGAGIGVICAIFLIAFFITFRSSRVVKRANIHFVVVFLTGIACVFMSLIIWTLPQNAGTCVSKTVLGMIGFGLIVGCILAKTQRYFRVYANFGYVPARMTTLEFYTWMSVPLILATICMILYIVGNGIPQAVVTQSTVDNTYVYISCLPGSVSWGNWLVGIFIFLMFDFIVLSTAILLLTMNLMTPYKESTFLLLICLDFIVLVALLIPLFYTVGDRRGSALQTFLLRSLGELFAMFLTMGLLFVPKMIYVLRGLKHGEQVDTETMPTYGAGTRQSMTTDTTETGMNDTNVVNYTEFSESDRSDSDYEGAGITGASGLEDTSTGRPQFVSMNVSRGSTMATGTVGSGTGGGSTGAANAGTETSIAGSSAGTDNSRRKKKSN